MSVISLFITVVCSVLCLVIMVYDVVTDGGFGELFAKRKTPVAQPVRVFAKVTLSEEDYRCDEWDHANRNIAYCPNPDCPSNR